MPKIGFSRNYFAEEKTRGPRRPGPPWTGSHGWPRELAGAWPPATPGLKVTGEGAGKEERSTGVPILGSPGLGRRRSGGATAVKAAAGKHSAPAHSGRGERGRRDEGGAVGGEDAGEPFHSVRGGAGWPGGGEERAPVVVRHNGVEGGHFQSGISRGVMGGGERAPAITEAERGGEPGGGSAREGRRKGGTCQRGREADRAEPAERPRPKRSGGGVARWADGGGSRLGRGVGREAGWAGLAGPKAKWAGNSSRAESEN
jgi:hypothetical protein